MPNMMASPSLPAARIFSLQKLVSKMHRRMNVYPISVLEEAINGARAVLTHGLAPRLFGTSVPPPSISMLHLTR